MKRNKRKKLRRNSLLQVFKLQKFDSRDFTTEPTTRRSPIVTRLEVCGRLNGKAKIRQSDTYECFKVGCGTKERRVKPLISTICTLYILCLRGVSTACQLAQDRGSNDVCGVWDPRPLPPGNGTGSLSVIYCNSVICIFLLEIKTSSAIRRRSLLSTIQCAYLTQ